MNKITLSISMKKLPALTVFVLFLTAMSVQAGDLTVDNLTVNREATFFGKVAIAQQEAPPPFPTEGLVLHFTLNGAVIDDVSGNGNDGTLLGVPMLVQGKIFGGFDFDGVVDNIRVEESPSLRVQNITMALWFKPSVDLNINTPAGQTFISSEKRGAAGGVAIQYVPSIGSLNFKPMAQGFGSAYKNTLFEIDFPKDEWVFVAGTYDGTERKLYVNGVLVKSITESFTIFYDGATELRVGAGPNAPFDTGIGSPFNGIIDEVRMYDRALSATEVRQLYEEGALLLHYAFDTDEGGIVTDQSGNGNNGAVNGATFTLDGQIGGAMSFDGVDDFITSINNVPISGAANRTLSFWFKTTVSSQAAMVGLGGDITNPGGPGNAFGVWVVSGSGEIFFFSAENDAIGATTVNDGLWHHAAATYDGSTVLVYVDGVLDITKNTALNTTLNLLWLGTPSHAPGAIPYDGLIDEVRIYDSALTADQISDLFLIGADISPASLDVSAEARFNQGILYTAPLGDLDMGEFTAP